MWKTGNVKSSHIFHSIKYYYVPELFYSSLILYKPFIRLEINSILKWKHYYASCELNQVLDENAGQRIFSLWVSYYVLYSLHCAVRCFQLTIQARNKIVLIKYCKPVQYMAELRKVQNFDNRGYDVSSIIFMYSVC